MSGQIRTIQLGLQRSVPGDEPVTLHAMGKTYEVRRHTEATLRQHRGTNRALAMIPASHLSQITHFAEDVELPTDAVTLYYATVPSDDPDAVMGEMVAVAIHVPLESRRLATQRRLRAGAPRSLTATLEHLGVTHDLLMAGAPSEYAELLQASAEVLTPIETAKAILFQHPELASLDPEISADMLDHYIDRAARRHGQLWEYISTHPPKGRDPWQTSGHALNGDGTSFEPPDDLRDKNGQPIPWPTDASGKRRIPQSNLSDGTLAAAKPALDYVLQQTKDARSLHGVVWKRNHGVTVTHDKQATTPRPPQAGQAPGAGAYKWSLANSGSGYGIEVSDRVSFDAASEGVTVTVSNTRNRCLGAYVQFLDVRDEPITPAGWKDRTAPYSQPNPTKKYVAFLRPASCVFGIAVSGTSVDLSFPFPDGAVKANILLGGLGVGHVDHDVSSIGLVSTCILNYGIPTLMIAFGVGLAGSEWYFKFVANPAVLELLLSVAVGHWGTAWRESMDAEFFLKKAATTVAAIVFDKALVIPIAQKLMAWVVGQQAAQALPVVGWAAKLMCLYAAAGNLASTTTAVLSSPSTYTLALKRAIDVQVFVHPDVLHRVWPDSLDHYDLTLTHQSGVSMKLGPFSRPAAEQAWVEHTFVNVPAGRGEKIHVAVNCYAKNEWLCGLWVSDWVNAVGGEGSTTLTLRGSLIERLVPLTSATAYVHQRKLAFDTALGKHVWQQTATAPPQVGKPDGTGASDHNVSRLVNITSNNLAFRVGYTWMASGQNLPLDNGTEPLNSQMYAFQAIGTGRDPDDSIKRPSRGFSVQPYLAFDQFGPLPLLTLPLTSQTALDGAGSRVPADVAQAFKDAGRTLAAGATRKIVTPSTEWWLAEPGKDTPFSYVLKRQPSDIAVFPYPNPEFSPRNFYLDPRGAAQNQQHLRHVDLGSRDRDFDYSTGKSWGVFHQSNLDAVVVHPRGYVIGVSYQNHKIEILELPTEAQPEAKAPVAIPLSGLGATEGLLNGPKAMTVTADGRLLILEQGNARVQAFDVAGNPVQCFSGTRTFTLAGTFAATLDQRSVSAELAAALQASTVPDLAPVAHLTRTVIADLGAGRVPTAVRQAFTRKGLTLSDAVSVRTVQAQKVWLLRDTGEAAAAYDLRDDGQEVPVRQAAVYTVEIQQKSTQWLIRDTTNVQTFRVRKNAATGQLDAVQLIATMALQDKPDANVEYLDIASEPEGFVYVLSYVRPGATAQAYRLDIYGPDGTFLTRTPKNATDPGVNAARITVDHWRTLHTLNYEVIQGPGGRTEPSVSQWAPTVPDPKP